MGRIMIFDRSVEDAGALEQALHSLLGAVPVSHHTPEDVFSRRIPQDIQMVFFTLSEMYDAEAARKFATLHRNVPMVVVSDSEEYGILSWGFESCCYYLLRPFGERELPLAIKHCAG